MRSDGGSRIRSHPRILESHSSDHGDGDPSPMRVGPMLPEEHALPGPQVELGVGDGDRERARRQDRADVRGHVVGAFGGVAEHGVAVGDEAGEVAFEVAPDARVGVLAEDERGARVVHEDRAEPPLDRRVAGRARATSSVISYVPRPLVPTAKLSEWNNRASSVGSRLGPTRSTSWRLTSRSDQPCPTRPFEGSGRSPGSADGPLSSRGRDVVFGEELPDDLTRLVEEDLALDAVAPFEIPGVEQPVEFGFRPGCPGDRSASEAPSSAEFQRSSSRFIIILGLLRPGPSLADPFLRSEVPDVLIDRLSRGSPDDDEVTGTLSCGQRLVTSRDGTGPAARPMARGRHRPGRGHRNQTGVPTPFEPITLPERGEFHDD